MSTPREMPQFMLRLKLNPKHVYNCRGGRCRNIVVFLQLNGSIYTNCQVNNIYIIGIHIFTDSLFPNVSSDRGSLSFKWLVTILNFTFGL